MKPLLTKLATHTGVILVILTVIFGPFQALAQVAESGTVDNQLTAQSQAVTAQTQATLNSGGTITPSSPAAANTPASTPQAGGGTKGSGCALWGNGSLLSGGDWGQCIADVVYIFSVGIGSGFAYVSAYFFDLTIQLSLNSAAYALTFVAQGWTTARDMANMAFLFILIYIAFMIMFESETSGTVQMLAAVIVVALLVNFSFFFTRLAIDAGNILSIQFYNAITAPPLSSTAGSGGVQGTISNVATSLGASGTTKDLTAGIMGMLNLQGLLSNSSFQSFTSSNSYNFLTSVISLSFLYISAGIMLWILTIMFITTGVKFLFRIVVLWFLIIASPLAFVARAVPKLRKYFDQWFSMLISHAFYPVAFMFIFLVLTNFATQMSGSNGLLNGIFNGLNVQGANISTSSFIAVIAITIANVGIRMGFVIAMLWIGLEASKKIGVMGGEAADKFGGWVGGGMLKAYNVPYKHIGPSAWAGAIDNSLKKGSVLGPLGNTRLGYELRRYVTKPIAGTAIPGSHGESFTQMKERQGKEKPEMAANNRDIDTREAIARVASITEKNKRDGKPLNQGVDPKDLERIQNLNKREMEGAGSADIQKIAGLLKENQVKTAKDSDKFTDEVKEKINTTWNEHSADAPLKKANKQIELLREINKNLKTGGSPVNELDKRVGSSAAGSDLIINSDAVADMVKGVKTAKVNVKNAIAKPGGSTVALQQNLQNLTDAEKRLEDLEKARKDIPTKVGGHDDKGSFDTSKVK